VASPFSTSRSWPIMSMMLLSNTSTKIHINIRTVYKPATTHISSLQTLHYTTGLLVIVVRVNTLSMWHAWRWYQTWNTDINWSSEVGWLNSIRYQYFIGHTPGVAFTTITLVSVAGWRWVLVRWWRWLKSLCSAMFTRRPYTTAKNMYIPSVLS